VTNDYKPIKIQNAVLHKDGKRVENYIHVFDNRIRKYFKSFNFYAEYDQDVSDVPLGILNIPALSATINIAWAVGCPIQLGEIDDVYLKGLECARKVFQTHISFKHLSFKTEINAEKIVENSFGINGKTALLFSGGLDSTASHILRKPSETIMIWGYDIPTHWTEFWRRVIKTYSHLKPIIIKTNGMELYDQDLLTQSFQGDFYVSYWSAFSFSINTLGVCAPIATNKVDTVMLASTFPSRHYHYPLHPFAYRPQLITDQYLGWADIKTFNVENEYDRVEKVKRIIKPKFDEYGPSIIRTCGNQKGLLSIGEGDLLNCNECTKCQRTIGALIVSGINPNLCGFQVKEETYKKIKKDIMNREGVYERVRYFWGPIQRNIPSHIEDDFNGSKKFLNWLKGYKL